MPSQAEISQRVDIFEGNPDPFVTTSIINTATAIVEQSTRVHEKDNVLIIFDSPAMQLVKEMKNNGVI